MPNNNDNRQETVECPVALAEDPQTIASVASPDSSVVAPSTVVIERAKAYLEAI